MSDQEEGGEGPEDTSVYTPGQVWSILVNGSDDEDEEIDVAVALFRMPFKEQAFLRFLAAGFTVRGAMQAVGMRGNQTRYKRDALAQLTRLVNGDRDE